VKDNDQIKADSIERDLQEAFPVLTLKVIKALILQDVKSTDGTRYNSKMSIYSSSHKQLYYIF